jgi:hypothetical protein
MKKAIGAALVILVCGALITVLVPMLTSSHGDAVPTQKTMSQPTTTALKEPPAWIKEDPSANDAYQKAEQIMTDPNCSREDKQDRMRVLQRNVGEELFTTVVRYVPVYDEESGTYMSFDAYMRQMAQDYPCSDADAPINYDPVGATMRIFFDTSDETIAAMTGVGLSPEEVQAARAKYEDNQRQREAATSQREAELKSAWEQLTREATDAAQEAQEQVERGVEEAQRQAEQAAQAAQEQLDQLQRQAEQAAREAQEQLDQAVNGIEEGLRDLFGW